MKSLFSIIWLTVGSIIAHAQPTGTYQGAVDQLVAVLKETPSFKEQVRGQKLTEYNQLSERIRQEIGRSATDYDAFYALAPLFFPFNDNHLGFYQLPATILTQAAFTDSAAIKNYQASKAFRDYPKVSLNLDSLESALARVAPDSVAGLYYYDTYLKIGLFKNQSAGQYIGVVLETTLPTWQKGQIAVWLFEYLPNHFRAIYGHPLTKVLSLYPNEKFVNQSLINAYFYSSVTESVYKKDKNGVDFTNLNRHEAPFQFKTIHDTIQYIRLGHFSARPADMKASQLFFDRTRDSLTATNLLVDLRNNTGGAYKVSKNYSALIKKVARKTKIYVLINNGTMSEAERVVLLLKGRPNIRVLGQTTKGTLAYGSNYGKTVTLPGGRFKVYLTDMKGPGKYLRYENMGVPPDIFLQSNTDWIQQTVQRITAGNASSH